MGKQKHKPPKTAPKRKLLPHRVKLEQEEPDAKDFLQIGGSPVPGLTLRHVLRGHTGWIGRIAWSPDGSFIASPSFDCTIRIWDIASGECTAVLRGHKSTVSGVAWSPDGHRLASGSADKTICIWNTETWKSLTMLGDHNSSVGCIAWSPNGQFLASGGENDNLIIWFSETWQKHTSFSIDKEKFSFVNWLSDSERLFIGYVNSNLLEIWNAIGGKKLHDLNLPSKHVYEISQKPNTNIVAIANGTTILLLDDALYQVTNTIEGHTHQLISLAFSSTGQILATKSLDDTVRIWNSDSWQEIAELNETTQQSFGKYLAFHPQRSILATLGEKDTVIRIWDIDTNVLLGQATSKSVPYTTAKLVLVGDSGVGKTGLGWRLAHGEFKEHASTHGQQFWAIPQLGLKRQDGTECEAVLWDLAGQHVYRQIHSIFIR